MSFSDDIALAKRALKQGQYEQALRVLKEITPLGVEEKRKTRETYLWGGNMAYEHKKLSIAIKCFQGAKALSLSQLEEQKVSQRIYFILFVSLCFKRAKTSLIREISRKPKSTLKDASPV